jgi:hypothetical protein
VADELQLWIEAWSQRYPAEYDDVLVGLAGKESFGHDDAEKLYRWKFKGLWLQRKINLMRATPEDDIRSLTRRAFTCNDELGALLILTLVPGLGAAGASAVLTAHDPQRYTVMDVRAIASLAALKRWDLEEQGMEASALHWPEYLDACRRIRSETDTDLRTVDRALWAANGAV